MTHLYPPGQETRTTAKIPPPLGIATLAFVAAWAWAAPAFSQDGSPQFHARFSDGTVLQRETLHAWHDANATPRLGSYPLFDADNPVQWLMRDRLGPVPRPTAFVEFIGGDRLPGVVVGASSSGTMLHDVPEHLLIESTAMLRRPNLENAPPLRVELKHVRRIVWQARETVAPPSTAVRRDGSQTTFRALRWSNDALALLTDSEIVTIPYDNLAEVHLPPGDSWQAYLDHTATLLPGGEGRLIQLETDSGLVALASTKRLRPETYGDNRYTEHWYQIIQPAWSLDPLWVRFPDIRLWRMFPPDRIPLTLLVPRMERHGAIFSDALQPTTNHARDGHALSDGNTHHGWGFATHAPCQMIVPVPTAATAIESGFGLDPSVDAGGCALARIELRKDDKASILFESETLIGSHTAQSTGRLPIPEDARGPGNTLHLIADPLIDNRPPGADPFDIRDSLNWYGPTLELDSETIRHELRRRAIKRMAPLAAWEFLGDSTKFARVITGWSTRDWDDPRFQSSVLVEHGFLGLRRGMTIPADARYLAVLAHSPETEDASPTRIQAKVNGKPVAELAVPVVTGRRESDPLLFPIDKFVGKTVTVELFQLPGNAPSREPAPVEWTGIAAVPRRPGLRNLLADPPSELAVISPDVPYQIEPPGFAAPRIAGWNFSITEEPALGEYRYIQWTWSAAANNPAALALAHGGEIGTGADTYVPPPRIRQQPSRGDDRGPRNGHRYIIGTPDPDNPDFSPAIALDAPPPGETQHVQRDLYNDFGPFIMTGLALATEKGTLLLGGLWLARTPDQFRHIESEQSGPPKPNPGEPPVLWETSDPLAFATLLDSVAPGFTFWSHAGHLACGKSHANRAGVLRADLSGHDGDVTGRFTAIVKIPPEGASHLHGAVLSGTSDKSVVRVLVDGQLLHEEQKSSSDEWTELNVNLDQYAGKTVRLELQFHLPNEPQARVYWHNIRVEHEAPAQP